MKVLRYTFCLLLAACGGREIVTVESSTAATDDTSDADAGTDAREVGPDQRCNGAPPWNICTLGDATHPTTFCAPHTTGDAGDVFHECVFDCADAYCAQHGGRCVLIPEIHMGQTFVCVGASE